MRNEALKILSVEDNTVDYIILNEYLGDALPYATLSRAISLKGAKDDLTANSYDVILLDLSLPDSDGATSINHILELSGDTPVIVFTGYENEQFGMDSLKMGVQDYLVKCKVNSAILLKSITYAIERKAILNHVKSSKENYKSLFDKNPVPLLLFDQKSYRILMVNQASEYLYMYTSEEMLALTLLDLISPDEKSRFTSVLNKAGNNSGAVFLGGWGHIKSDGTEIEVEVTIHDFLLGQRPCRLAVVNDVTDRNMAKRNLEMSESKFRSLVQSGSDLIGILDNDGNYLYESPTVLSVLGYSIEALIGKSFFNIVHDDDICRVKEDFENLKENLIVSFKPFRVKDVWGNWRWIESIGTNLLDDPTVNGIVTNSRDITGKKKQEDERTILINELTQNNKDLTQFSFITSHNLRAPITNLLSNLELYDHAQIKDEKANFFVDMFRQSTHQLNETINDLIKILVIRNNGNVGMEQVVFSSVFEKTMGLLSSLISNIPLEIKSDFLAAPTFTSNLIYLESIFMNLLSNSIKYRHPDRGLLINIFSKYDKENNAITLCFEDNGLGIDLVRNKHKIFGLHQRFHEQGEGKGIGLYLIQSQIKALGGTITVDSAVNIGTTFTITFYI
jgi:PAS domain S-box-containing protein